MKALKYTDDEVLEVARERGHNTTDMGGFYRDNLDDLKSELNARHRLECNDRLERIFRGKLFGLDRDGAKELADFLIENAHEDAGQASDLYDIMPLPKLNVSLYTDKWEICAVNGINGWWSFASDALDVYFVEDDILDGIRKIGGKNEGE